jgi:hypothetical protein
MRTLIKRTVMMLALIALASCGKNSTTNGSNEATLWNNGVNQNNSIINGTSSQIYISLKSQFQAMSLTQGAYSGQQIVYQEGTVNCSNWLIFTGCNISTDKYTKDYVISTSGGLNYDHFEKEATFFTNIFGSNYDSQENRTYTESDKTAFISKVFGDDANMNGLYVQSSSAIIGGYSVQVYKITKPVYDGNGGTVNLTYIVSPSLPLVANPISTFKSFPGGEIKTMVGYNNQSVNLF